MRDIKVKIQVKRLDMAEYVKDRNIRVKIQVKLVFLEAQNKKRKTLRYG